MFENYFLKLKRCFVYYRLRDNGQLSPSMGSSENLERFHKLRKPFVAFGESGPDPFGDDFDTKTVINDLFGEEIELMDKERLEARYDVLDLENIGIDYGDNEDDLQGGDSAKPRTRLTTPLEATTSFNVSSLRKKSVTSNFTNWDEFDISMSNSANFLAERNSTKTNERDKRNFH